MALYNTEGEAPKINIRYSKVGKLHMQNHRKNFRIKKFQTENHSGRLISPQSSYLERKKTIIFAI